jgi:dsRNA-specific ribonuclease
VKDKFHVTNGEGEEFEEDLLIENDSVVNQTESIENGAQQTHTMRPSRRGPEYQLVGQNEAGMKIYRRKGADYSNIPTKLVEQLWPAHKKRSMKTYQKILVEEPMKDADLDFIVEPSELHDAPLDFSRLSSMSQDIAKLMAVVGSKTRLKASAHRNQLIQAFESVPKNQDVKPMDRSLYAIGKELIELHVLNALTSTYPNLPPDAIIRLVEQSTNPQSLSRALLGLGLEPFIAIVPNVPLSKFADPSQTCMQLATNAYFSLTGLLYQDLGFDGASSFVFETLPLVAVTPAELKRLKLLDGVKDAKRSLTSLLFKLRSPLPSYEIESVLSSKKGPQTEKASPPQFTAVVKSGSKIIGRGQASSKPLAESRAAANALLDHWCMQSEL